MNQLFKHQQELQAIFEQVQENDQQGASDRANGTECTVTTPFPHVSHIRHDYPTNICMTNTDLNACLELRGGVLYKLILANNDADKPAKNYTTAPTENLETKQGKLLYHAGYSESPSTATEKHCKSKKKTRAKSEIGRYTIIDLNIPDLQPGNIIRAVMCYIQDLNALRFFICLMNNPDADVLEQIQNTLSLRQYVKPPHRNVVFGLVLDGILVRAIRRRKLPKNNPGKQSAYLLDFGENVQLSEEDIMYKLQPEHQKIPAQAILCELTGVRGCEDTTAPELQAKMEKLIYGQVQLYVTKRSNNMLTVQLIEGNGRSKMDAEVAADIAFFSMNASSLTGMVNNTPDLISFQTLLTDNLIDLNSSGEHEPHCESQRADVTLINTKMSQEVTPLPLELFDVLNSKNLIHTEDFPSLRRCFSQVQLTSEQRAILLEKPVLTSNAIKAGRGYVPQDDKRICRFCDSITGNCFKGATCKLEHTALQRECYTKDIVIGKTIQETSAPVVQYKENTIITIKPTHIITLNSFYGIVRDSIQPLIWPAQDVKPWSLTANMPLIHDIVLAKYVDGNYYRARVIDCDRLNKRLTVFYVDYGNQQDLHLRSIAHCGIGEAQVSARAVVFHLPTHSDYRWSLQRYQYCTQQLCDLILNIWFEVRVLIHDEDITIHFVNEEIDQKVQDIINIP